MTAPIPLISSVVWQTAPYGPPVGVGCKSSIVSCCCLLSTREQESRSLLSSALQAVEHSRCRTWAPPNRDGESLVDSEHLWLESPCGWTLAAKSCSWRWIPRSFELDYLSMSYPPQPCDCSRAAFPVCLPHGRDGKVDSEVLPQPQNDKETVPLSTGTASEATRTKNTNLGSESESEVAGWFVLQFSSEIAAVISDVDESLWIKGPLPTSPMPPRQSLRKFRSWQPPTRSAKSSIATTRYTITGMLLGLPRCKDGTETSVQWLQRVESAPDGSRVILWLPMHPERRICLPLWQSPPPSCGGGGAHRPTSTGASGGACLFSTGGTLWSCIPSHFAGGEGRRIALPPFVNCRMPNGSVLITADEFGARSGARESLEPFYDDDDDGAEEEQSASEPIAFGRRGHRPEKPQQPRADDGWAPADRERRPTCAPGCPPQPATPSRPAALPDPPLEFGVEGARCGRRTTIRREDSLAASVENRCGVVDDLGMSMRTVNRVSRPVSAISAGSPQLPPPASMIRGGADSTSATNPFDNCCGREQPPLMPRALVETLTPSGSWSLGRSSSVARSAPQPTVDNSARDAGDEIVAVAPAGSQCDARRRLSFGVDGFSSISGSASAAVVVVPSVTSDLPFKPKTDAQLFASLRSPPSHPLHGSLAPSEGLDVSAADWDVETEDSTAVLQFLCNDAEQRSLPSSRSMRVAGGSPCAIITTATSATAVASVAHCGGSGVATSTRAPPPSEGGITDSLSSGSHQASTASFSARPTAASRTRFPFPVPLALPPAPVFLCVQCGALRPGVIGALGVDTPSPTATRTCPWSVSLHVYGVTFSVDDAGGVQAHGHPYGLSENAGVVAVRPVAAKRGGGAEDFLSMPRPASVKDFVAQYGGTMIILLQPPTQRRLQEVDDFLRDVVDGSATSTLPRSNERSGFGVHSSNETLVACGATAPMRRSAGNKGPSSVSSSPLGSALSRSRASLRLPVPKKEGSPRLAAGSTPATQPSFRSHADVACVNVGGGPATSAQQLASYRFVESLLHFLFAATSEPLPSAKHLPTAMADVSVGPLGRSSAVRATSAMDAERLSLRLPAWLLENAPVAAG